MAHANNAPLISALFDDERSTSYQRHTCGIWLDFAKQKVDSRALDLLQQLANKRNLAQKIDDLAQGRAVNFTESRGAWHTLLRAPNDGSCHAQAVAHELDKMAKISARVHGRLWRGVRGQAICDVVNIGVGGSDLGAKMVCHALDGVYPSKVRIHFVASMDGGDLARLLPRLDPATTLFIVASKSFDTVDTLLNAQSARAWLYQLVGGNVDEKMVMQRHFIGVSANMAKMDEFGIYKDNQLLLWDFVGGRFSLWSAVGLVIALKFGMDIFSDLLAGAHQMDLHFYNAPFMDNLPVLLGALCVYNSSCIGAHAHAVLPYDARLALLPDYLGQLEMESNGKQARSDGTLAPYATCPVLWGQVGSNAQHAFYQLLHQGTPKVSCDFIAIMHTPTKAQQIALANCLAQAQILAFGTTACHDVHQHYRGDQPSSMILLERLDARTLGALLALYEHKVYVASVLWDVNAFDQWGVQMGKICAQSMVGALQTGTPIHVGSDALVALIHAHNQLAGKS